jgi:hypothetical protein
MKQAGWIYKASADGTSKDTSGVAANDLWGGGGTPTNDTYPTAFSATSGPWWVAQGPQVLKLAITAASTGTFVRGEQVSQATSAATGEILGYVFDPTNFGWIIVMPRTGTFDGTHLITGAVSAATVTPTSLITYTQEICIWKNSGLTQQGTVYWIFADASGESASLFSTLASGAAGCTATVAPAGGGTGNSFPTSAIALLGAGGSSSAQYWTYFNNTTAHALISAANATPSSGVSADGTAWFMSTNTTGYPSGNNVAGIFRLDDTEPGDVCPFEGFWLQSTGTGSYSRTTGTSANVNSIPFSTFMAAQVGFNGYIARGVGGTPGTIPDIASYHRPTYPAQGTSGAPPFVSNNADLVRAQNHPATIKPLGTDTVALWSDRTGVEQSKGRVRWLRYASAGNLFDTTDSKMWVCWVSTIGASSIAVYIGPWDGSTTPAP